MEIIDSHIHPPLSDGSNLNWFSEAVRLETSEQYFDHLKRAGITRCCGAIIQFPKGEYTFAFVAKMNQSALEFHHKVGDFYIPGLQLDLDDPDKSCAELDHYYHKEGVRWIGELYARSITQDSIVTPGAFEIYDLAQKLKVPISIYCMEKDFIWKICRQFPRLNLVLSHSAMTRNDLEPWLQLTREAGNLYLDLPPSITSRFGLIKMVVDEIGSHKVIFGSGFPIRCPQSAIASYLAAGLNDSQLETIFSLNFKRLTGIM